MKALYDQCGFLPIPVREKSQLSSAVVLANEPHNINQILLVPRQTGAKAFVSDTVYFKIAPPPITVRIVGAHGFYGDCRVNAEWRCSEEG
jgi:hypothetical protein